MARPEFEPTESDRKLVESMSGYGVPYDQIAALVGDGIHRETLAKHFEKELIQGKAKANAKVSKTLFQKIVDDNDTTAMIWWTKTQMGWKETKEVEVVDKTSERKFIIERAKRDDNND
jgi:hypothetical protein